MGRHVIWHDQDVSPPHAVDPIRSLGAPGLGGSETMNRTTRSQRLAWIGYATRLIEVNSDGVCTNTRQAQDALMAAYGISRASAKTAVVHAIMRARREMWVK